MTTDVFDESGLEADDSDFAWDAFESDGAGEVAAETTDLESDDPEPDDSEFQWDRFGLDEDQPGAGGASEAGPGDRFESAFGRMEETVRLSDSPPEPSPAPPPASVVTPPPTTPPPQASRSRAPAHARERNRVVQFLTATAAAGCILLAVILAAAVMRSAQRPPAPASGSPAATAPVAPQSSSDPTRILVATDELDSATTAAQAGFATLPGFPTPVNVANVVTPYLSSLHLYEIFMSETSVPQPAQAAAHRTVLQVRREDAFLATIEGLPPAQLGAFLREYSAEAGQLQVTLATLERDLQTKPAR